MSSFHISLGSKKKTTTNSTSTSTPLDQYAPAINQGVDYAQQAFKASQPAMADIGGKALDVYNGLKGSAATANSFATGANPALGGYQPLMSAGANDPSMGILKALAAGSSSPGNYDGFDKNNPLTADFYKKTLDGGFLNANPYLDNIVQQGTDAATKAVNQRFASSGIGEGLSTPYADLLSKNVADSSNSLRYGAYNDELARMGQIGGQSDAEYNTTQARGLNAQQAKDASFNADRSSQLAAAQSLGSQNTANNATSLSATNDNVQAILDGLGLSSSLGGAQLGALGASATLPFAGASSYADIINQLTGKYGTNTGSGTSTEKSTPGLFDWMQMFGQNAAAAAKAGA